MTDSTSDLTQEQLKELNVVAAPLTFMIDDKSYFDYDPTITMHEFYESQRRGAKTSTSQISTEQYVEFIRPLLQTSDVLYLCFSSGLSGSYNSALAANMELQNEPHKLTVVDTKAASLGEGLLVMHAAKKRDEGLSLAELAKWVEDSWHTFCHIVTVDNLHYLRLGGRISAATEILGSMLDVKPLIYMNREGKLIPDGKVRGRKRALNHLIEQTKKDIVNPSEQVLTICHGDCLDDAEYVRKRLIEEVGVIDVKIGYAGAVIGSHTGPGVISVFFVGNNRK